MGRRAASRRGWFSPGTGRFRTIQIFPKDRSSAPQHSPAMDSWPRSYSQLCGEQAGATVALDHCVALTSAGAARCRHAVIE
jgi:hypothetical protein